MSASMRKRLDSAIPKLAFYSSLNRINFLRWFVLGKNRENVGIVAAILEAKMIENTVR